MSDSSVFIAVAPWTQGSLSRPVWALLLMALAAGAACDDGIHASKSRDGGRSQTPDARGENHAAGWAHLEGSIGDAAAFTAESVLFGTQNGYAFGFTEVPGPHYEISITNVDEECGDDRISDSVLYIDLFQNLMISRNATDFDGGSVIITEGSDAKVTQPGPFFVWSPDVSGRALPPTRDIAVATYGSGNRFAVALSGTVNVTAVSDAKISADFDLVFAHTDASLTQTGTDHLLGTLTASFCTSWSRSASVPGLP